MYYELTKEQYKKYEKEFKKTYVGKMSFIKCMAILGITVFFLAIILFFPYVEGSNEALMLELSCYIIVSACLVCEALLGLNYKNELKDYIQSQKK